MIKTTKNRLKNKEHTNMLKCKIEVFAHRCMSTTDVAPFWKESLNYIQLSDHILKISLYLHCKTANKSTPTHFEICQNIATFGSN